MKMFDLVVDELVEVWRRSNIRVEAETIEEAANKVKHGLDYVSDVIFEESDYIYESEDYVTQDALHPITVEVMDEHYNVIADNDIRNI